MKKLIETMFPREEWDEIERRWRDGDMGVVAYPLVLVAAVAAGLLLGA